MILPWPEAEEKELSPVLISIPLLPVDVFYDVKDGPLPAGQGVDIATVFHVSGNKYFRYRPLFYASRLGNTIIRHAPAAIKRSTKAGYRFPVKKSLEAQLGRDHIYPVHELNKRDGVHVVPENDRVWVSTKPRKISLFFPRDDVRMDFYIEVGLRIFGSGGIEHSTERLVISHAERNGHVPPCLVND